MDFQGESWLHDLSREVLVRTSVHQVNFRTSLIIKTLVLVQFLNFVYVQCSYV